MRNRLLYIDFGKAVAIFLVVWMHCLQYIFHTTFENSLYAVVYAFHMPLFLIISGYLLDSTNKKSLSHSIQKRSMRLLVPNIFWGTILILIIDSFNIIEILNSFWFLYVLLICSISYLLCIKFIPLYVATIILSFVTLLLPGCEYIKFSIPYVGIGLLIRESQILDKLQNPIALFFIAVALVIYYVFGWNKSFYIYITPSPSLSQFEVIKWQAYISRLIFGSLTSIELLASFKYLETKKIFKSAKLISIISSNSLGLYVIHLFLLIVISDSIVGIFQTLTEYPLLPSIFTFIIAVGLTYIEVV